MKKYNLTDPILFREHNRDQLIEAAPYYIVENFLSEDECNTVTQQLAKYDNNLQCSSDKDTPDNSEWYYVKDDFDKDIINRCLEVNKKVFNLSIDSTIYPKYTIYKPNRFVDWHVDGPYGVQSNVPDNAVWRKLSVSLALNDSYEGGEFQIIASGMLPQYCLQSIKLSKGSALFFPPFLAHKVTPITKGVRKILVYWFCGPRFK